MWGSARRAWLMAGYAALQLQDAAAGREALTKAAAFEGQRQAALVAMRRLPNDAPSEAEAEKGREDFKGSRPSPGWPVTRDWPPKKKGDGR
jgi:hypothetical protein